MLGEDLIVRHPIGDRDHYCPYGEPQVVGAGHVRQAVWINGDVFERDGGDASAVFNGAVSVRLAR